MFKVGDKVRIPGRDEDHGIIVYGPYQGDTGAWCLVEKPDGHHFAASVEILRVVPKFEVGQKVTFRYSSTEYEIVSGPYPDEGEPFWVYKDGKGNHGITYEMHVVPVVE